MPRDTLYERGCGGRARGRCCLQAQHEIVSRYPRIQNMIRADPLGVGMLATMALGPFAKMSRRPSPSEYARSVLDVPFADRLAGTQRRLSSASTPIYRE
jgi:hypothetical protein